MAAAYSGKRPFECHSDDDDEEEEGEQEYEDELESGEEFGDTGRMQTHVATGAPACASSMNKEARDLFMQTRDVLKQVNVLLQPRLLVDHNGFEGAPVFDPSTCEDANEARCPEPSAGQEIHLYEKMDYHFRTRQPLGVVDGMMKLLGLPLVVAGTERRNASGLLWAAGCYEINFTVELAKPRSRQIIFWSLYHYIVTKSGLVPITSCHPRKNYPAWTIYKTGKELPAPASMNLEHTPEKKIFVLPYVGTKRDDRMVTTTLQKELAETDAKLKTQNEIIQKQQETLQKQEVRYKRYTARNKRYKQQVQQELQTMQMALSIVANTMRSHLSTLDASCQFGGEMGTAVRRQLIMLNPAFVGLNEQTDRRIASNDDSSSESDENAEALSEALSEADEGEEEDDDDDDALSGTDDANRVWRPLSDGQRS